MKAGLVLVLLAVSAVSAWEMNSTALRWSMDSHYMQCGASYSGNELGTCSDETICTAGCAMTSVTNMNKHCGGGKDPGEMNSWLKSNGGYSSGCLIVWAKPCDLGNMAGGVCVLIGDSYNSICSDINNGVGYVIQVLSKSHYVLAHDCDTAKTSYKVYDPYYSTTEYAHSGVTEWVKYKCA
ncbi:hypothetical protein Pelo_8133 [Pelomyxa schiedti]|nr:hypothetical protein Pelo_12189 [Pelomyxa schiedti]KAH3760057.1 hypothetical protein Pelo_8133 [Pelomyxa schiedti]